ncbi:hypothetical protein ACROYT_G037046 [Oculina patagonica]
MRKDHAKFNIVIGSLHVLINNTVGIVLLLQLSAGIGLMMPVSFSLLFGLTVMTQMVSCSRIGKPCPAGKKTDDPQGRCCVFPFVYKGVSYDSCTSINHNKLWCSFDAVYAGQWANCVVVV